MQILTESESESVIIDGRERTFLLAAPPSGTARDLLLVFHGSGQSARTLRRLIGAEIEAFAVEHDTAVAYLDGYRHHWNDARRESRFAARLEDVDDVAFAKAVAARAEQQRGVHRDRVFALGYSNGGQMVARLLHEEPDLLAGAAIIAATLPAPENFLVDGTAPPAVPLVIVHGTKDRVAPFSGGRLAWWARTLFRAGGAMLSAQDSARYYARARGIVSEPTREALHASTPRTRTERRVYARDGVPAVILYIVSGGGHTVPGRTAFPAVLGPTSHDIPLARLLGDDLGVGESPSL